jgi:ABC-type multidrug transport system fused ATPase/permease subunit
VKHAAIASLVRYVLTRVPLLYLCLFLALLSVAVELSAMASLFPLAEIAAGREISAASHWGRFTSFLGLPSGLEFFLILFLGLLLLRSATTLSSNALTSYFSRQLIARFSSGAFSAFMQGLTLEETHRNSIGYYIGLAGDEANRASEVMTALIRLVPTVVLGSLYFAAIIYVSTNAALGVIAFLVASLLVLRSAFVKSHALAARQQAESRALNSHFIDSLSSLRTVRGFTAEGFVVGRYAQMLRSYARTCFLADFVNMLARAAPAIVLLTLAEAWAVWGVDATHLAAQFPFVVVIVVLLMRFFPVVGQAIDIFIRMIGDIRVGQDVAGILRDAEQRHASQTHGRELEDARVVRIQFDQVSFHYRPAHPILRDFSADFIAGESYAIVGPSGVGKSTFVDLLLKFYEPTDGRILINAHDLSGLDPASVRQRILIVEQHARIFNETVFNNIAFGLSPSLEEVRGACRIACVEDDIDQLPEGFSTMLNYQGSNLSGGQRQRLALARALLRSPDVLVLDEATNALDHGTRSRVIANVCAEYRSRLLICVTHDREIAARFDHTLEIQRNDLPRSVEAAC